MNMRNITTCYSEHATKVSDSYCSGQNSNHSSPSLIPSIRESITCIYKTTKLSKKKQFLVKITWCDLIDDCQGFTVSLSDHLSPPFRFDHKNSRLFHKMKGFKEFKLFSSRIEVSWDLSNASYEQGPEPYQGFYLTLHIDSEECLKLGDIENPDEGEDTITKSLSGLSKFSLISRIEQFSGGGSYSTKVKFRDRGGFHEITIRCVAEDGGKKGNSTSMLCVWIDGKSVVRVKRLQLNFRGNQTIFIEGIAVDLMWDIHGWFFGSKSGYGMFMFRTRSGLDSRLWLEERRLEEREEERCGFSLLIRACKNPD